MPAATLVDLCTRACIKNVDRLTDVGIFEYCQLRPVLQCIKSPAQLHQIEINSPQISGEDAELWQKFIRRDIPNWGTKNYVPKDPRRWYNVYMKYKKEQQKEIERDEQVLRDAMAGIKADRDSKVSKVVSRKELPKLPKDSRMIGRDGVIGGGHKGFRKETASSLTWTAGSKTKMTNGASVLTRARREAKEISARNRLVKPTHELHGRAGQIKKAPAGMVNEYRTAAQPALKIFAARRSNPIGQLPAGGPSLEDREKRLRAAMSGGHGQDANLVDFEESDSSVDDIFEEQPKKTSVRPVAPSPRSIASSRPSQAARPTSYQTPFSQSPQASRPRPGPDASSTASPVQTRPKPSDMISSVLSKSKPAPRPVASSSTPTPAPAVKLATQKSSTPTRGPKSPSPGPGGAKPMLVRKRPEVDVFNRKVKRQRMA